MIRYFLFANNKDKKNSARNGNNANNGTMVCHPPTAYIRGVEQGAVHETHAGELDHGALALRRARAVVSQRQEGGSGPAVGSAVRGGPSRLEGSHQQRLVRVGAGGQVYDSGERDVAPNVDVGGVPADVDVARHEQRFPGVYLLGQLPVPDLRFCFYSDPSLK